MEDECFTDIFPEEFECAECDYKAVTETEMIDHSLVHICKEEGIIVHTEQVAVNIKSHCESKEVRWYIKNYARYPRQW